MTDPRIQAATEAELARHTQAILNIQKAGNPLPYLLENIKLTLPVNDNKQLSGLASEIYLPELFYYQDEWFYRDGDAFVFVCPASGAKTDNTDYCRTELYSLDKFSCNDVRSNSRTIIIDELAVKGKTVVHQIHDQSNPWVKITTDMGTDGIRIRALVNAFGSSPKYELTYPKRIALGEAFKSTIEWDGKNKKLACFVNDDIIVDAVPLPRDDLKAIAGFKFGNYGQASACKLRHIG